MKVSQNIDIRELVPEETWKKHKEQSVKFIDDRLPTIIEAIRSLCGNKPVTLNNWHTGGQFSYRGYRPPECKVGAIKSMHRDGKAADFTVKGMTAEQVRCIIRLNQTYLLTLGLTRIEKSVSWVHIDLKYTGLKTLYEFNP